MTKKTISDEQFIDTMTSLHSRGWDGCIDVGEIAERIGCSRATARKRLLTLAASGEVYAGNITRGAYFSTLEEEKRGGGTDEDIAGSISRARAALEKR